MIRSIRFQMPTLISVILILLFPCLSFADQFKCTRVVDGDTIKVANNGNQLTIRLVGIDAPETAHKKREPGQPFSQSATKFLAGLILKKIVEIKSYGQDRYGRTLGVVYANGMNVNLEMIKAGLAEVYRGPPASSLDLDPFWNAEDEAKKENRGMWVLGDKYISLREWRKMNR